MREIIFRGKRVDNVEWIYGDILTSAGYSEKVWISERKQLYDGEICGVGATEVIQSTIGQYTGLTDNNGEEIFEGDIVKDKKGNLYTVEYGAYYPSHYASFICQMYGDKIYGFYLKCNGEDYVIPEKPQVEIIGNIFDTPEFVEDLQI